MHKQIRMDIITRKKWKQIVPQSLDAMQSIQGSLVSVFQSSELWNGTLHHQQWLQATSWGQNRYSPMQPQRNHTGQIKRLRKGEGLTQEAPEASELGFEVHSHTVG